MSTETDYEKLLKKQILAFDLHKNQSYVNRLLKEGEIKGYIKLQAFYKTVLEARYIQKEETKKSFKDIETSMKKFKIDIDGPKISSDIYRFYQMLTNNLKTSRDDLAVLKATESIFLDLSIDVENSLTSLDILEKIASNKGRYSNDVQARIDSGFCGLKRPGGTKKFNCDGEVVEGTKYCKEHLKQHDPIAYTDIFPED